MEVLLALEYEEREPETILSLIEDGNKTGIF
jgi:hypothetical protein